MTNVSGTIDIGGITVTVGTPATAPGYDLLACGLADIGRRRDVAISVWVPGAAELKSVEDELTYEVVVQCVGTDWGNACDLADALHAVAEQKTWSLTETLDGHVEAFTCDAATRIAKPIERDLMINARRTVTLTIPVERA